MRFLILLISISFSTTFAAENSGDCYKDQNFEVIKTKDWGIQDITGYMGYENVDWTEGENFQGEKIVLKLRAVAGPEYTGHIDEDGYITRYVIAETELEVQGDEYTYLKFTPISKEEALELEFSAGTVFLTKEVDYLQINLKKDLPIGEKLFATFEPARFKGAIGYKPTDKLSMELNGESAIGYAYGDTSVEGYEDVSNFYLSLRGGFKVKHKDLGAVKFFYGIDSGTVMAHAQGDTIREGRVRGAYEYQFNKDTSCEVYAEKRSFQLNPGYDEETGLKQDRLYEKAKTFGVGCRGRFELNGLLKKFK